MSTSGMSKKERRNAEASFPKCACKATIGKGRSAAGKTQCSRCERREEEENQGSVVDAAVMALNALTGRDPENEHAVAEEILKKVLRANGLGAVADAFEAARDRCNFWYA